MPDIGNPDIGDRVDPPRDRTGKDEDRPGDRDVEQDNDRDDPYVDSYHRYRRDNRHRHRNNHYHYYYPLYYYYPWYVCGHRGHLHWGSIFCHDYYYPWTWYYCYGGDRVVYVHDPYYVGDTYVSYSQIDEQQAYPPMPTDEYLDPDWTIIELIQRGQELFAAKDYLGAAESFRQAMMKDINDPAPKFAYAQALFALGNYPHSSLAIRYGMDLVPDWPLVGGDPRDLYTDPDEFQAHLIALDSYLENRPNDPSGLLLKGYMNYFTQDLTKSSEAFAQLIETSTEDDEVALTFLEAIQALQETPVDPSQDASVPQTEGSSYSDDENG